MNGPWLVTSHLRRALGLATLGVAAACGSGGATSGSGSSGSAGSASASETSASSSGELTATSTSSATSTSANSSASSSGAGTGSSTGTSSGGGSTGVDPYPLAVLADAPAAYYRLDDNSSVLTDLSGNSLSGTYGQAARLAAGLIADGDDAFASQADASDGAFAEVAAGSALAPVSAITVEAWVSPSQAALASYQDLVAYGNGALAPYDNYKLELTPPNVASFQVLVDGRSYKISTTQTFTQGQTWHLAGTYDSKTGTEALYIDGNAAAWGTIAVNPVGITPRWVACIGDSLTLGSFASTGYPADLSDLLNDGGDVQNFGHGSATVQATGDVPYLQQPEYTAATDFVSGIPDGGSVDVIIMLGTNDSKTMNWVSSEAFSAAYLSFVQHFQSLHADVNLFLVLPPTAFTNPYSIQESVIEAEIPLIQSIAAQVGATTIDLQTPTGLVPQLYNSNGDGVHFSDEGYQYLAQLIQVGILVGSETAAETNLGPYTNEGLTLGAQSDHTAVLQGTLDEVAIYQSALTAERLQAHYDAGTVP